MSDFIIITSPAGAGGDASLATRSLGSAVAKAVNADIEEQLRRLASNVGTVIAAVGEEISGYGLDTVEVAVAVDAKGTFGIASAGMNASFKLTFGRRSASSG